MERPFSAKTHIRLIYSNKLFSTKISIHTNTTPFQRGGAGTLFSFSFTLPKANKLCGICSQNINSRFPSGAVLTQQWKYQYIFSVYASARKKWGGEFREKLSNKIYQVEDDDLVVIEGDLNAHVRNHCIGYEDVIEEFGARERNQVSKKPISMYWVKSSYMDQLIANLL